MATYGRSYNSVEEMLHRARVFADNLAHINAINANPAYTWSAAVNKEQRRKPATKERWKPAAQIRESKLTSAISCICWNRPELPPWPAFMIICSTF
jgi:hypothetical protein